MSLPGLRGHQVSLAPCVGMWNSWWEFACLKQPLETYAPPKSCQVRWRFSNYSSALGGQAFMIKSYYAFKFKCFYVTSEFHNAQCFDVWKNNPEQRKLKQHLYSCWQCLICEVINIVFLCASSWHWNTHSRLRTCHVQFLETHVQLQFC